MRKAYKLITTLFIIALLVSLTACSSQPKGDPQKIITQYLENIKNNDAVDSYALLSSYNKKNCTEEDFTRHYDLTNEILKIKDFKTVRKQTFTDTKLDDISFKNSIEFSVVKGYLDYATDKEKSETSYLYVVNDSGEWKIYESQLDIKNLIANDYNNIGWMYEQGKGKDKDVNQAIIQYNEALSEDSSLYSVYYNLAVAYLDLEQYNEVVENAQLFIDKADDPSDKSDGYNLLGTGNKDLEDYDTAREDYNEALNLDPNNQYAKTNLDSLP
jgi:tetratricopeptide (TPR) repeat protein